jgi:insulysin
MYNFNCLNYLFTNFINEINKFINNIFVDDNEKYFNNVIDELIEYYNNKKYSSPTQLVSIYLNMLIGDDATSNEIIDYLKKINYSEFKVKITSLLIFSKEYILFLGNFNVNNESVQIEKYFNNLIEIISTNKTMFKKDDGIIKLKGKISNYILKKDEYNPKEINNCLYECYEIKKFNINYVKNQIVLSDIKKRVKYQFISNFIAGLIHEPLYDRLRTTEKLGYIVRCSNTTFIHDNVSYFYLIYIVQSTSNIEKIKECINNFNNYFLDDFNKNIDKYKDTFLSLKKSKLLYYSKNYSSLDEEISYYVSSILKNYNIFNLKKMSYQIIEKITFDDIKKYINYILSDKPKNNYSVLIDINN